MAMARTWKPDDRAIITTGIYAGRECVIDCVYGSYADVRVIKPNGRFDPWPFPEPGTVPVAALSPIPRDEPIHPDPQYPDLPDAPF